MADPKDECVDCAKLPYKPKDLAFGEEALYDGFRSKPPRKIHPKSRETHKTQPRCGEHWRAWDKAQKVKAAAGRSRKRSGLDDAERQELWEFQGERCPCGRGIGWRLVPDADHDHDLAAEHDHDEAVACRDCMRGFLCRRCNRDIIGPLYGSGARPTTTQVIAALRGLADYLEDPPMAKLRRARTERSA